jgi:hypothetical protein
VKVSVALAVQPFATAKFLMAVSSVLMSADAPVT